MAYAEHFIEGLDKMSKTIQDHKLVTQECERESFVLSRVRNKMRWNGCAPHEIPLQTSWAGTISMEECLPESPKKSGFDKLVITGQGEIHGSLCVSERQLRCYGSINKESYIDLVGDDLQQMSQRMTSYVDRSLLLSGAVDEITSNPGALDGNPANTLPAGDFVAGSLFVKCPKTFSRGDAFEITSDTIPTPLKIYVTSVNASDSYVVFQTNPVDGTAPVPAVLAPYTLEDNAKIAVCGYKNQIDCGMGFCSIDEALGFDGSTTYFGVDRDVSPILRGDEYDLTESTGATIVKDLMQVFYRRAESCSAKNLEVLVCYAMFSVLAKELEHSKQRSNNDKNARIGYRTITFCTPEGEVKVTAVPKMPCDTAYFINWNDFVWMGDASPTDPTSPSAQSSWFRSRDCSYNYYKDIYFRGKLVNKKPCNSARVKLDPVKYLDCV